MAVNNLNRRVAYGLTDPLLNVAPLPIVSQRAPTANDKAEIGTEWIDQPANSAYILTSIVANMANWEAISGGGGSFTLTGDNGGAIAPVANNINILGSQGEIFSGTPGTLTASFERLELGESGSRLTATGGAFSIDGATLQVYASTSGGGASTSYTGFISDLSFVTGDGSNTGIGGNSVMTAAAGSNIAIGAGSQSFITQSDGSIITTTCAGAINSAVVNESDAGDQAAINIAGSIGFLSFGVGAANPVATRLAAVVADVALDPQSNTRANGVLVTRSISNGGTAGAAAFKVLSAGTVNNWGYGLDLYNGSGTLAYSTADLRFWNQSFVLSAAGNVTFSAHAGSDWIYKMGDNAGANAFIWQDSTAVQQMSLNSDGELLVQSDIHSVTGDVFIGAAAKGVVFASTCQILSGTGSPDTVVTAAKGSLFLRTDGSGINDRAYINTDGAMAWTAIVTVA